MWGQYRVCYGVPGHRLVLLLCGGDKRTRDVDIDCAMDYWQDWKWRTQT